MSLYNLKNSKSKAAIAKAVNVQVTIAGDYEASRQQFIASMQSLQITFDANNNVIGNVTNDDIDSLQTASHTHSKSTVNDLNQTITNPPTQAEVQAISDKIDELLAALRTGGVIL